MLKCRVVLSRDSYSHDSISSPPSLESNTSKKFNCSIDNMGGGGFQTHEIEYDWWLVVCTKIIGFSACKGRILKQGDAVTFSFPIPRSVVNKCWGGARVVIACIEIVRYSTK